MFRLIKSFPCLVLVGLGLAGSANAFTLIGPAPDWQTLRRGYGGSSGPMNFGEEYRWNVPTIYYGYDSSFLNYFGAKGAQEVDKAFAFLNALPSMASLNLDNYPLDTRRPNDRAQALNILDLKSYAMGVILAQLGFISPPVYVYTLRDVVDTPVTCTSFLVIRRNFDPVSIRTSSFINGGLWTYTDILCSPTTAFPLNQPVDPLYNAYPVAGLSRFGVGQFFDGFTRDDVGALKYSYQHQNQTYENSVPGAGGGSGGPFGIPGGTNSNFINTAVRYGVDKPTFVRANFDSLVGQLFTPITNIYSESVITNGVVVQQQVSRFVGVPDIIFTALDTTTRSTFTVNTVANGPNGGITSVTISVAESSPAGATIGFGVVVYNTPATVNGGVATGPGTFNPVGLEVLNNTGPLSFNANGFFVAETNSIPIYTWGSFGSSTNIIIYPEGSSIAELENQVLSGGGGSPWSPAVTVSTNQPTTTGSP